MREQITDLARRLFFPALALAVAALLVTQVRGSGQRSEPAAAAQPAPAAEGRVSAEGRLVTYPGAEVTVGTDLAGTLVRVLVHEKEQVRRGQLLAEVRADDLRAALAEAQARKVESEADLRLFAIEVERAERLLAERVGTPQQLDRARRDLEAGQARLATAGAAIRRLEAELAKTRITAPISGTLLGREVDAGETVAVGQNLFALADLSRTRVEAEIDEFDAGRLALGDAVRITAEGYAGTWQGHVEEIPDQVVARRLRPTDPGRPADTRVLLVKVALDGPTPLKLGQRVEIEIGG